MSFIGALSECRTFALPKTSLIFEIIIYLPDGLNEEIVNISEDSVEILSINLELGDIKKVREHISENSFYSFSNYSANKEKHVITKYFRCHHSQAPLSKVQKRKLATG